MLNALDITKFVTHAYNAIIDVMDNKLEPEEILQKIYQLLEWHCEMREMMHIRRKQNN